MGFPDGLLCAGAFGGVWWSSDSGLGSVRDSSALPCLPVSVWRWVDRVAVSQYGGQWVMCAVGRLASLCRLGVRVGLVGPRA